MVLNRCGDLVTDVTLAEEVDLRPTIRGLDLGNTPIGNARIIDSRGFTFTPGKETDDDRPKVSSAVFVEGTKPSICVTLMNGNTEDWRFRVRVGWDDD